ncbi:MAG TPA: MFS transporter [Solirubrobacteraceae bacterium]|jgi:predicted MFS family arabinose efflux permease|nr:MFS transporter [Solirubrobacteraceae bacterium]
MSSGLGRYASLLTVAGVRPMVITGITARLPLGMVPLAIVLVVRAGGDSYSVAGVAVAAYSLAAALAVPRFGRLIDRLGQTRILLAVGGLQPVAVVVLALLAAGHATPAALVGSAALVGATVPPVGACVRTLWGTLAPPGAALETAYALEASVQEVTFVAGPLLVAALAGAVSAIAALLAAGAIGGAGTLAFAATAASRSWHPSGHQRRPRGGALRAPAVLTVVVATAAMGAAFGAIEVVSPAFAEAHGSRAAAGFALGAFSLGSLVGGFVAGMTSSARHPATRYLAALTALALALVLPIAAGSIVILAALLFVAGLPIAPAFASAYSLINRLAMPGSSTESFAWISTAVTVGASLGTALGGAAVQSLDVRAGFALSAALAALGAAFAFSRRRRLSEPPATPFAGIL